MTLPDIHRQLLLDTARQSIRHGLAFSRPLKVDAFDLDDGLLEPKATFVTLKLDDKLRGCMGGLNAHQPLIHDVSEHAYMAAFSDPRFSPVASNEAHQLSVHISILQPKTPIRFTSERDLISQLVPGVDGVLIARGDRRGTFLPSVWASLPDADQFLGQLKQKARIDADCDDYAAWRYVAESVEDE